MMKGRYFNGMGSLMFLRYFFILSIVGIFCFSLISCSSDSGSSSTSTGSSTSTYLGDTDVSGSVIDGPLENALVFLDINENGEFDEGSEPSTYTDENGEYTLNVAAEDAKAYKIIAQIQSDTIDSDKPDEILSPYTMSALSYGALSELGFSGDLASMEIVLNPFTSMLQNEIESGNSPDQALINIGSHLGLDQEDYPLLLTEYVTEKDGDLSDEDLTVLNRLHNIARTAARVMGDKLQEVVDYADNDQGTTLTKKEEGLASASILHSLKLKLSGIMSDDSDLNLDEIDYFVSSIVADINTASVYTIVQTMDSDNAPPGKPTIDSYKSEAMGEAGDEFTIAWDMFYGENAAKVELLDFWDKRAGISTLSIDTPNPQAGEFDITLEDEGVYKYKVCLENDNGKSCSDYFSISVLESPENLYQVVDSAGTPDFPVIPSGDADKRPATPKWDGWMQGVNEGCVVNGDFYAPGWNKWSGLIADRATVYRTTTNLGEDGAQYTSSLISQPAEWYDTDGDRDGLLTAMNTWDQWYNGEVIGQAGGQAGKFILQDICTASASLDNVPVTQSCYYIYDGEPRGTVVYYQVELCREEDGSEHCSVSDVLELKIVAAADANNVNSDVFIGTIPVTDSDTDEEDKDDIMVEEAVPAGVEGEEDLSAEASTGGDITTNLDISAPMVNYINGSWAVFDPDDEVTISAVCWWGKVGESWKVFAEGPYTVSADGTLDDSGGSVTKTELGSEGIDTATQNDISNKWEDSVTGTVSDLMGGLDGVYKITAEFCVGTGDDEFCVPSTNNQTMEVASGSTAGEVRDTVVTDTIVDDTASPVDETVTEEDIEDELAAGESAVEYLTSEAYLELEREKLYELSKSGIDSGLLNIWEARQRIETLGVEYHEIVDGEDVGPDVNSIIDGTLTNLDGDLGNVVRVNDIFTERYNHLTTYTTISLPSATSPYDKAEAAWEYLFPMRNGLIALDPNNYSDAVKNSLPYTYKNFLKAIAKYPKICGNELGEYAGASINADKACKLTLATMFAHFVQETGAGDGGVDGVYTAPVNGTSINDMKLADCAGWYENKGVCGYDNGEDEAQIPGWRQALFHVIEYGCGESNAGCGYDNFCGPTTWTGETWPCPDGVKYFGRGPKQLSYNFNYGPFSEVIYGDVKVLLNEPEKVIEGWLSFGSAVYFFMQPRPPKPSMFELIYGYWNPALAASARALGNNFGTTTMIINGGVECGGGSANAKAANREIYFMGFMDYFGLQDDLAAMTGASSLSAYEQGTAEMTCHSMDAFDSVHGATYPSYWTEDYSSSTKDCTLVSWEWSHSGFIDGHYENCIKSLD